MIQSVLLLSILNHLKNKIEFGETNNFQEAFASLVDFERNLKEALGLETLFIDYEVPRNQIEFSIGNFLSNKETVEIIVSIEKSLDNSQLNELHSIYLNEVISHLISGFINSDIKFEKEISNLDLLITNKSVEFLEDLLSNIFEGLLNEGLVIKGLYKKKIEKINKQNKYQVIDEYNEERLLKENNPIMLSFTKILSKTKEEITKKENKLRKEIEEKMKIYDFIQEKQKNDLKEKQRQEEIMKQIEEEKEKIKKEEEMKKEYAEKKKLKGFLILASSRIKRNWGNPRKMQEYDFVYFLWVQQEFKEMKNGNGETKLVRIESDNAKLHIVTCEVKKDHGFPSLYYNASEIMNETFDKHKRFGGYPFHKYKSRTDIKKLTGTNLNIVLEGVGFRATYHYFKHKRRIRFWLPLDFRVSWNGASTYSVKFYPFFRKRHGSYQWYSDKSSLPDSGDFRHQEIVDTCIRPIEDSDSEYRVEKFFNFDNKVLHSEESLDKD